MTSAISRQSASTLAQGSAPEPASTVLLNSWFGSGHSLGGGAAVPELPPVCLSEFRRRVSCLLPAPSRSGASLSRSPQLIARSARKGDAAAARVHSSSVPARGSVNHVFAMAAPRRRSATMMTHPPIRPIAGVARTVVRRLRPWRDFWCRPVYGAARRVPLTDGACHGRLVVRALRRRPRVGRGAFCAAGAAALARPAPHGRLDRRRASSLSCPWTLA